MNETEIKKLNNTISKHNAGEVIPDVICTVKDNIKWNQHQIMLASRGICADSVKAKFKIATNFDQAEWLRDKLISNAESYDIYFVETIQSLSRQIRKWRSYDPQALTLNWGRWYGKPLNARGVAEIKRQAEDPHGLIHPLDDGVMA